MNMPPAVESVILKFYRGVFGRDGAALAEAAMPHPELGRLGRLAVGSDRRESLEKELAELQGSVVSQGPGRATAHVYFRCVLSPVALVWMDGGWRVDARWWIASLREPAEWDYSVRAFMFALMAGDDELIQRIALQAEGMEVLLGHRAPAGEMSQYEGICEMMPILDLEVGEEYPTASGGSARVAVGDVGPDRKMALAQLSDGEIPLGVVKVDGRWRIDATELIRLAQKWR